jgi:hypothetical protein
LKTNRLDIPASAFKVAAVLYHFARPSMQNYFAAGILFGLANRLSISSPSIQLCIHIAYSLVSDWAFSDISEDSPQCVYYNTNLTLREKTLV